MVSSTCQSPPDTTEVSAASREPEDGIVKQSRAQKLYIG
jgi:hypothetical protein